MPPFFDDIDETATKILNDDYTSKTLLKMKYSLPQGATITTETTRVSKGDKTGLTGKLSAKYRHCSGFSVDKLAMSATGSMTVETSLSKLADGLTLTFKADDAMKGDLGVEYVTSQVSAKAEIDALELSNASASAVVGSEGISLGGAVNYNVKSAALDDYNVGVSYDAGKWFAGLRTTEKLGKYTGSVMYAALDNVTLASTVGINPKGNALQLGGVYKCNPNTTLRAKTNSDGMVAFAVVQQLKGKLSVTGACEIDVKALSKSPKLGLSVTMG